MEIRRAARAEGGCGGLTLTPAASEGLVEGGGPPCAGLLAWVPSPGGGCRLMALADWFSFTLSGIGGGGGEDMTAPLCEDSPLPFRSFLLALVAGRPVGTAAISVIWRLPDCSDDGERHRAACGQPT